jgi:hypothetical protein
VSNAGHVPERAVRFTEEFFDRLDYLLPEDRGADGTPSVTDFLAFELPTIRDRLASDYERSTMSTADLDVRVFVGAGVFVSTIALYTALEPSGVVAVFWINLGRSEPTDP